MNNLEIKQYKEELKNLESFFEDKTEFNENEIINWVSDCVVIFCIFIIIV